MRWYQFQLRKPKRWARRAKSDGSANPQLKRVSIEKQHGLYRVCKWILFGSVPFVLMYGYLLSIYFKYSQHWFSVAFPFLFTARAVVIVVVFSFTLKFAFYFGMMTLSIVRCRVVKRHARVAIAHRCHLCPRCGYSLQSRTDDTQPCPECGQRISRREAVRLWARFCR